MPEEFLTRREHEEFARRMSTENARIDDENNRQNKRLDVLEGTVKKIEGLTVSIERMSTNIENMTKEISKQGARLESLEAKPAKRWEAVANNVIKVLVAAVIGFVLARIGVG